MIPIFKHFLIIYSKYVVFTFFLLTLTRTVLAFKLKISVFFINLKYIHPWLPNDLYILLTHSNIYVVAIHSKYFVVEAELCGSKKLSLLQIQSLIIY